MAGKSTAGHAPASQLGRVWHRLRWSLHRRVWREWSRPTLLLWPTQFIYGESRSGGSTDVRPPQRDMSDWVVLSVAALFTTNAPGRYGCSLRGRSHFGDEIKGRFKRSSAAAKLSRLRAPYTGDLGDLFEDFGDVEATPRAFPRQKLMTTQSNTAGTLKQHWGGIGGSPGGQIS